MVHFYFGEPDQYYLGANSKTWAGLEDNQHLGALLESLTPDRTLPQAMHAALWQRYRTLVLERL